MSEIAVGDRQNAMSFYVLQNNAKKGQTNRFLELTQMMRHSLQIEYWLNYLGLEFKIKKIIRPSPRSVLKVSRLFESASFSLSRQ